MLLECKFPLVLRRV